MPATYPPALVGLMGRKRHGKDTFADMLVQTAAFTKGAFADPLREAALAINPYVGLGPLPGDIYSQHPRRYADVLEALGYERAKDLYPEVRLFIQRLGTEGVRALDPDFWVRIAAQRIDARPSHLILTDVRFPNEADLIKDRGGILVRVVRPGLPADPDEHVSESALDGYRADVTLVNRDLDDFRGDARRLGRYLAAMTPIQRRPL